MMLRPAEEVHKFLLSTPASFAGEYETRDILITHAWPDAMSPARRPSLWNAQSPIYRTYLVAVLRTETRKEDERFLPNYHYWGDLLAVCLAVLFGKRFDHHGMLETGGLFCLPTSIHPSPIGKQYLAPFNHEPRKDGLVPLNLVELSRIAPLLELAGDQKAIRMFLTAGGFYLRSLQGLEDHPEAAFVDLVTAGEVLSNFYEIAEDELLDDEIKELIAYLRTHHPSPDKAANLVRSRLYQVRRRYTKALTLLLNDYFFGHTESTVPYGHLEKGEIVSRIRASYDLRSRYVHTGLSFGGCITGMDDMGLETGAHCVMENQDDTKLVNAGLSYVGLERTVRYCLLSFVHKHICQVDPRLA
jgi:hypothetical protein